MGDALVFSWNVQEYLLYLKKASQRLQEIQ